MVDDAVDFRPKRHPHRCHIPLLVQLDFVVPSSFVDLITHGCDAINEGINTAEADRSRLRRAQRHPSRFEAVLFELGSGFVTESGEEGVCDGYESRDCDIC